MNESQNQIHPESIDVIGICADECVTAFCEELSSIGIKSHTTGYRSVMFTCTPRQYYQIHLMTRSASRILTVVKEIPAGSDRILFDKARRIHWPKWIRSNCPLGFEVYEQSKEQSRVPKDIAGSKLREAISDSFAHLGVDCPPFRAKDSVITVVTYLQGRRATISLETSGLALHKRGYRLPGHPATLKETTAASLLQYAGYQGKETLIDLGCGTGTFAIEAGLIAQKRAPGLLRSRNDFGCEQLVWFDYSVWRQIQDELRGQISAPAYPILGVDIDQSFVELAKSSAQKAKLHEQVSFHHADFFTWKPQAGLTPGLVIANLPYGERLPQGGQDEEFMEKLGQKLRQDYAGWRVGLLGVLDAPWHLLRMKHDKRLRFSNGGIPVQFGVYEVFPQKMQTGEPL